VCVFSRRSSSRQVCRSRWCVLPNGGFNFLNFHPFAVVIFYGILLFWWFCASERAWCERVCARVGACVRDIAGLAHSPLKYERERVTATDRPTTTSQLGGRSTSRTPPNSTRTPLAARWRPTSWGRAGSPCFAETPCTRETRRPRGYLRGVGGSWRYSGLWRQVMMTFYCSG